MFGKNRYLLLTVDTEALPKRAAKEHVKRLMWGEHAKGTAGIREMAAIGDEFGAKHIYFVDLCGAYTHLDEVSEVIRWLDEAGQDVQLHTHPEYLPKCFWEEHGYAIRPRLMNLYVDGDRATFVIQHFSDLLSAITHKPVLAHRAGSFRWNAHTIHALRAANIPLSFNNSMRALHLGQCVYSVKTNQPFTWSNGIIEVPMTEKSIFPMLGKDQWWSRLTYPESDYFHFSPWWGPLLFNTVSDSPDFAVLLLHSWSLLYWDENGHGEYRDDARVEGYRQFIRRLSKDYDIITTADFLDLHARGMITTPDQVDLALAEWQPPPKKKKKLKHKAKNER